MGHRRSNGLLLGTTSVPSAVDFAWPHTRRSRTGARSPFRKDDPGDHPGGGHCAGLPDAGTADQWLELLDQHHRALDLLVDHALADDNGWALPRPILFAAHHTCEVALKAALAALPGSPTYDSHHLPNIWNQLAGKQGLGHLTEPQRKEAKAFLDTLHNLTPDGFTARHPSCLAVISVRPHAHIYSEYAIDVCLPDGGWAKVTEVVAALVLVVGLLRGAGPVGRGMEEPRSVSGHCGACEQGSSTRARVSAICRNLLL